VLKIAKIWQEDPYHFLIQWTDGAMQRYHLGSLQRHCPCQRCREGKKTGEFAQIKAKKIVSVGNYALRILFETGCVQGIYTYELLKGWVGPGENLS